MFVKEINMLYGIYENYASPNEIIVPTAEMVTYHLDNNYFMELELVDREGFLQGGTGTNIDLITKSDSYVNRVIADLERITLGWIKKRDRINYVRNFRNVSTATCFQIDREISGLYLPVEDAFIYATELQFFKVVNVYHFDECERYEDDEIYDSNYDWSV